MQSPGESLIMSRYSCKTQRRSDRNSPGRWLSKKSIPLAVHALKRTKVILPCWKFEDRALRGFDLSTTSSSLQIRKVQAPTYLEHGSWNKVTTVPHKSKRVHSPLPPEQVDSLNTKVPTTPSPNNIFWPSSVVIVMGAHEAKKTPLDC